MLNRSLAEKLRQFLQSAESMSPEDKLFYSTYRDEVIERAVEFFSSREFAYLRFRAAKNDPFQYITFYLRGRSEPTYADYEIRVFMSQSQFALHYVADDEERTRPNDPFPRYKLEKLNFESLDDLFAQLEPLKEMIARIAEAQSTSEP
jgi:hypothetical protein